MSFISILNNTETSETQPPPDYFYDLSIRQIIDFVTSGKETYDLKPFFNTPLHDKDTVIFRQEVMEDFGDEKLLSALNTFSEYIYSVSAKTEKLAENLAKREPYAGSYLTKGMLLESAEIYCKTIKELMKDFASYELRSHGLISFREYISAYASSDAFRTLCEETDRMRGRLAEVHYTMLIKDLTIRVRKYEGEEDHTPQIEKIFAKFRQGDVKDYRQKITDHEYAEHVEAGILEMTAKLYPDIFSGLDSYCGKNAGFVNRALYKFSREIQFYIAYTDYMKKFRQAGLAFCRPLVSDTDKDVSAEDFFDMALAEKLINEGMPVIQNSLRLSGKERIFVVSGPNQGGKTTFARTFGQLHHFAALGCPVPGTGAKLFLPDMIFTHFEREEDVQNQSGKLQDDLLRMHGVLKRATSNSIIIINEFLSTTTLEDALSISRKIIAAISELDCLCVTVTFLDETVSFSEKTVSMVSTVYPEDPARRTYKVLRNPPDGLAYAMYIAQKYRVTYNDLKERIKE